MFDPATQRRVEVRGKGRPELFFSEDFEQARGRCVIGLQRVVDERDELVT
jgi:hypothetical protein